MKEMKKLNIGCGKDVKKGYINLDNVKLSGVDIVHNINKKFPFEKNTFDFFDVIQKLESKLEPQGSISTKIAVSLWKKGDTSINAKYTSGKTLVRKLFQKALSAITYNRERIEKIYKEKKPVSF